MQSVRICHRAECAADDFCGFTGWDWAIWEQTLVFTLANFYKNLRKVRKNSCGQTTHQNSKRDGVQMIDTATAVAGVLISAD
jgi:hypothetical protein